MKNYVALLRKPMKYFVLSFVGFNCIPVQFNKYLTYKNFEKLGVNPIFTTFAIDFQYVDDLEIKKNKK